MVTGDPDENVFVVQQGKVNVFITGGDGSIISLKVVKTGDSVTSLLSFTDVLTVSSLREYFYFSVRTAYFYYM